MGFAVYYVIFNTGNPNDADVEHSSMKLILVQRKPGEYCEIFNDEDTTPIPLLGVEPPYLVTVDSQTVLVSRDPINGSGGFFAQGYWTFDKDGPIFLDLSVVDQAEKSVLPPGWAGWHGKGFDIQTLTFSFGYEGTDPDKSNFLGVLYMTFALKDHQLVLVSHEFDENCQRQENDVTNALKTCQ